MHKKSILLIIIIICTKAFAHNPQVSTISIIQQENKKWSVFITAPLVTYQLAISNNFPTLKIDSLDVYTTQNIILDLLRKNLLINGRKNIKLINNRIQIAHETTIYFELEDTSNIYQVNFTTFRNLVDHFTLFKLVPFNKSEITYILQSDNKYIYQPSKGVNIKRKDYWFVVPYIITALFIIVILYFIFNKFNKYRRIQ